MDLPKKVRLVDVGPRDGLQNEPSVVPTEAKVELIHRLANAGLPSVEATSFVSPKWVPQMADHSEVMRTIRRKPGVSYPVLVPNMKGLESALAAGVDEIAGFAAATESFSQRNTNCTIEESMERFAPVCEKALASGMKVRGYISVVLECPFEGSVNPRVVADIAKRLMDMGCYEVSLGDTTGMGTPGKTKLLMETLARDIPPAQLGGHFHDTYGQALANILASMEVGVATFDASIAGLGGCPYSPGATGNVSTEDVVYMLDGMGIETGISMDRLLDASQYICEVLKRQTVSRAGRALLAKRKRALERAHA
ncbi:MAG: hydroxymethylglutaryl-CoA lyase [Burkholderiales bacterium]